MESNLDTIYYGEDSKAYISYDIPKKSITNRFDFTKKVERDNKVAFKNTFRIHAIIEAIHDNYVIMNCLINHSEGAIQRRKFDKEPLEDVLELYEGEGVEIIINTYPGRREFIYASSEEAKDLFEEPEDIFSKYKGSPIFPDNYGD